MLGLIALLALGATALLAWLDRVQSDTAALQARVVADRAFADARATVLYALSVESLSTRGLEIVPLTTLRQGLRPYDLRTGIALQAASVRLDARPYQLPGGAIVRLQDARGLLGLNTASSDEIERLLQTVGVAAPRARTLAACLLDYIDADQLVRPGGAEAAAYRAAGRAPPPDRPLRDVGELALVLGFADAPSPLDDARLLQSVHAGFTRGIGINSAAAPVLRAAGFNETQIAALLAHRRTDVIDTMAQLQAVAGLATPPDPLRFPLFPADEFRVELEIGGRTQIFGVTLTPRASDAPFRIDYSRSPVSGPSHGNRPEFAPLPFPDVAAALPPA
ncbi:hypothetical protein TMPK1_40300 [Rhodospirillales bacterium TMPK1]|uniref:T2SS protein K first SAM-like domain-containing protein n=1 Tax=Roseiterribacter gracilis TaxID=2812848 RepID=A0A8S8XEF9_9PROT|nr:hypothetical protein TMPK1_40300 [Rhodospirillales bacterium TMPK1]